MQRERVVADDTGMSPWLTILWLRMLVSAPACTTHCETHCSDCVPECLEACEERCRGPECARTCRSRCARECQACVGFCRRQLGCDERCEPSRPRGRRRGRTRDR